MSSSCWSSRIFGALPESWPLTREWTGEWMTIGGETWFSRIAPDGDPAMPPIVMIHGLIVSGTYFHPLAARLDDRYTIYVPDMPGYGRATSKRTWDVPSLAIHLADWMDAHDLSGAVLVAHSLGCQISTMLSVTRPDLVRGMVLIAPTVDADVRNELHLILRGLLDFPREKQSIWTIWIPDFLRVGIRHSLTMLHLTMLDNQLDRLGDVHLPTLLVGGERDPIVPPRWVHEMAGRMPNARTVILPGSPHAMTYCRPHDLARVIDTAIQGWTCEVKEDRYEPGLQPAEYSAHE